MRASVSKHYRMYLYAEDLTIHKLTNFSEKGPTDIRVLLKEREAAAAKANPAHSSKEDQIQGSATLRSSLPRAVISFNTGELFILKNKNHFFFTTDAQKNDNAK